MLEGRKKIDIYTIPFFDASGNELTLAPYKGKYILVVNTAVLCGFATQYISLCLLQEEYLDVLQIIAFPSNQFKQQPGTLTQAQDSCRLDRDLNFPVMQPVLVNGPNAHPLFRYLKQSKRGFLGTKSIKWNFTKFFIGRDGLVLKRFSPITNISAIRRELRKVMDAKL